MSGRPCRNARPCPSSRPRHVLRRRRLRPCSWRSWNPCTRPAVRFPDGPPAAPGADPCVRGPPSRLTQAWPEITDEELTMHTTHETRKRKDRCADTRRAATRHCDAACPTAPLPGSISDAAAPTPRGNNTEKKEKKGGRNSPALRACAGGGSAHQALSMSTRVITLVALLVLVRTPTFWPRADLLLPVLATSLTHGSRALLRRPALCARKLPYSGCARRMGRRAQTTWRRNRASGTRMCLSRAVPAWSHTKTTARAGAQAQVRAAASSTSSICVARICRVRAANTADREAPSDAAARYS